MHLPFPNIDNDPQTTVILSRITRIVREHIINGKVHISNNEDAQIEYLVSQLFGLKKTDYDIIFDTINDVQQMIPFKRLLNITKEDIFTNGI